MTVRRWDVVVVGAGPVGSLLAGALAGHGASVLVLERDREIPDQTRASTLNSRAMEILSALGVPGLEDHPRSMFGHYGGVPVDLEHLDSPWAGLWTIPQPRLVRMLRDWATGNGAVIDSGVAVVGARIAPPSVLTDTADGVTHESRILVGADGRESTVRAALDFGVTTTRASRHMVRCDVTGIEVARRRFERHGDAVAAAGAISPRTTRLMLHCPHYDASAAPSFAEVAGDWLAATGERVDGGKCVWLDTFSNACATVRDWQVGSAFLAGDAAHDQPPVGGSSLNAGIQDVYNLAWKLAAVLGGAPAEVVETYGPERAEATARMQEEVRDQEAVIFGPDRSRAEVLRERLAGSASFREDIARSIAGLDTRYPSSTGVGPRISPAALSRELGRPLAPDEESALGRRTILVTDPGTRNLRLTIPPDGHAVQGPGGSSTVPGEALPRRSAHPTDPVVLKAGSHA